MKNSRYIVRALVTAIASLSVAASSAHPQSGTALPNTDMIALDSAARMTLRPSKELARFNYIMKGQVRLLIFWKSADDVGGGYIREGVSLSDPAVRLIQVLFGSDPKKAPLGINYWGAATEAIAPDGEAFFGFMKSTESGSVQEARGDIQSQNDQNQHAFKAVIAFVANGLALSRSVRLFSDIDFDLHQLDRAQQLVLKQLDEVGTAHRMDASQRLCSNPRGFLKSVEEMIDHALASRPFPVSKCYVHDVKDYTLTLTKYAPVPVQKIQVKRKNGSKLDATYHNLTLAQFSVLNHHSSERTAFELLLGNDGDLKGVPIQIVHQPNFWFRVILNLDS